MSIQCTQNPQLIKGILFTAKEDRENGNYNPGINCLVYNRPVGVGLVGFYSKLPGYSIRF